MSSNQSGNAASAARELLALVEGGSLDPAITEPAVRLLTAVLEESAASGRFRRRLAASLAAGSAPTAEPAPARRTGRRPPGRIDPYAVLAEVSEPGLRLALEKLSVEELKDVVAQHGMDRDRLAMKWKDPERLIGRIIETAVSRSGKGDAFRRD